MPTTSTPPIPIERSTGSGKKKSPASPMSTAAPEREMVCPAVPAVRATAASSTGCRPSSSRKRLTTSSA